MTAGDSSRFTPAAIASSDSPVRRLWHARCTATSDDEHAVSTATDGPRRSRKYDSRFAMMLSAPPVAVQASTWLKSLEARNPYSLRHAPTKTPVCVRRNESAGMPAFSKASQATSRTRRCWGSISAASLGEMPKNSASNTSISSRNEPHRVVWASAAATSGDPSSNGSHRSSGTCPIADRRSDMNCHNVSELLMPSGKTASQPGDGDRLV